MDFENKVYPLRTAGRNMIFDVPTALKNDSVKKVLSKIKKEKDKLKTINYVYIVENSKLLGIVTIKKILFSNDKLIMKDLMVTNYEYVTPETDEEKVADLMIKENIKAVPVIKKGIFLGVVPNDRLMTIINNSLTKDLMRFAGIHKSFFKYENTLEVPFFENVAKRLPWLLIGLVGITLAAGFINLFESLLNQYLIIAFFIPAMVYMSGAISSQHQTLLIRDFALMGKNLDMKKYFLRVVGTGALLGIIIGLSVFLIIALFWKETFMGLIIGVSMIITFIVSSLSSIIITSIINRFKFDPAVGSGPLSTIISDVSSIMIYFLIVSLLLKI